VHGIGVIISKDTPNRITVAFRYNPELVAKIKTILGYRWHPAEKHWSFPDTDGTLEKILRVFKGGKIHLDLALQAKLATIQTREMAF
jgi:hypothetical protein